MRHTMTSDAIDNGNVKNSQVQRSKSQKRLETFINAALVLTVCISALVYTLPIFGNRLHAPQSTYNFGVVKAGTQVRHRFTIRNLHPWPIVVSSIGSSCGCTQSFVGKTPPFRLAPVQSIDVTATLDTRGRKGDLSQAVHVTTDDNPQGTSLVLTGEVR